MKKAFTLIELLVVVAIIGMLATIVGVNVLNAQKAGRDSKRVSSLLAFETSLNMYNTAVKKYPTTNSVYVADCKTSSNDYKAKFGTALSTSPDLVNFYSKYLNSSWPKDELKEDLSGNSEFCFAYKSDGNDYAIMFQGDTPDGQVNWAKYSDYIDPSRDSGSTYDTNPSCSFDKGSLTDDEYNLQIHAWKIYSSGAKCW